MSAYSMERAVDRITELAGRGEDLITFWRECTEVITPLVPFYYTPCFFTLDPATLLATSHYEQGLPEIPHEWLVNEYAEDDFNKMADVARSERGISTLDEATGGDPTRSRHFQFMTDQGADQECVTALRTRAGEAWGALGLYREIGQPRFSAAELEFLLAISAPLAEGARRALLIGEARDPDGPDAPGLLVLDENLGVESVTPGTERWLADLPGGESERGNRLPAAVASVAGQAQRTANAHSPGEVAFARVLGRSGRWVVLHGASLISDGAQRVAVIVEPAHPARITPLLMAAYGLTEREQEVTRLVLAGDSTDQIAATLFVSPHTVQQHLKKIFEKTGVRSRRELTGRVFFSHYEPRLRDNERRTQDDRPVRGGPLRGD